MTVADIDWKTESYELKVLLERYLCVVDHNLSMKEIKEQFPESREAVASMEMVNIFRNKFLEELTKFDNKVKECLDGK